MTTNDKLINDDKFNFYKDIPAITVDLTEGCNLACDYCFTYSDHITRRLNIPKFKIFLNDWINSVQDTILHVGWWGGEPFIEFEVMKELTTYVQQKAKEVNKEVHFGLTTNGTVMNKEIMDWLLEIPVKILISCDGIKQAHDMHRKYKSGAGSWDKMHENILLLKEHKVPFDTRLSISTDTVPYFFESIKFLAEDIGMKGTAFSLVSEGEWTNDIYNQFRLELDKCIDYNINRIKNGLNAITLFHIDDQAKDLIIKRKGLTSLKPCGSGVTYMGFGIDGTLWPCHRFNKHGLTRDERITKSTCLGYYNDDNKLIILNKDFKDRLIYYDNNINPACQQCMVQKKHNCNGFCIATNYDINNDAFTPCHSSCEYEKIILEYASKYIVKLLENNIFLSDAIELNQSSGRANNFKCYCYEAAYSGVVSRNDLSELMKLSKRIIQSTGAEKTEEQINLEHQVLNATIQLIDAVLDKEPSFNGTGCCG
jgi:uncharacterized protein